MSFTNSSLFVQPSDPMKNVPTVTLAASSVPVVSDRSVVDTALAFYTYFVAPSGYEEPVLAWISDVPNETQIELVSNLIQCTIVPVPRSSDAKAARLARRGKVGTGGALATGLDSIRPGTENHAKGLFLFFADPLAPDDVQAIDELGSRRNLISELSPVKFCSAFRWYQPGIRTGDGMLPTRYVEFYSGVFFKAPFSSKTLDVVLMSDDLVAAEVTGDVGGAVTLHDWYKVCMKTLYHHSITRVANRYQNPFSKNFNAFVIQTAQFYEEYSSRWDAVAELQILSDLVATYIDATSILDATTSEIAGVSAMITEALGSKSSLHLNYTRLMTASFTETKKVKPTRRLGRA